MHPSRSKSLVQQSEMLQSQSLPHLFLLRETQKRSQSSWETLPLKFVLCLSYLKHDRGISNKYWYSILMFIWRTSYMHFCAVTMNSEPFEMGWLSLKTFQKGDMNLIWAKRTQTKCAKHMLTHKQLYWFSSLNSSLMGMFNKYKSSYTVNKENLIKFFYKQFNFQVQQ